MNKLKGGLADNLSVNDIADKFNKKIEYINKQLDKGIEVESEHTDSKEKAKEIAMDHISEFPNYYEELEKMEGNLKSEDKSRVAENKLDEKLVLKDYSLYIKLVADAYQKAKDYDSSVISHWDSLNSSNYTLFKRLLSKVNVVFTTNDKSKIGSVTILGKDFKIVHITPQEEYKTQSEMKKSFNESGILKISIDYSEHPLFSIVDNIVFRTVHDYIAHILGNHDFGAKGEIACYNLHAKMAPKSAIPALFTEVVGQASTTIVNGDFPKQKIALLEGFDYTNIGLIDDKNYEIKDKRLIKKGELETSNEPLNREEPKAIHKLDREEEINMVAENKLDEIFNKFDLSLMKILNSEIK